jgi:membrane protein implicated in regulation of membrane protease activity
MLFGLAADIWLYGVSLVIGILLSLPSALGRGARAHHAPRLHHGPRLHHSGAGAHRGHGGGAIQRHAHQAPSAGHRPALPRYSPLNPIALSAFLGGFGALGLIGRGAGVSLGWSLLLAVLAGLALSIAVFRLFVRYVLAAEGSSALAADVAVGRLARVVVAIPASGIGSVAYEAGGRRHTLPACTVADYALRLGDEVVVVALEGNVAIVARYED